MRTSDSIGLDLTRTLRLAAAAAIVVAPLLAAACGGGAQTAAGPATPGASASAAPTDSSVPDAGPTTTTTTTLGSGGDLQGAKLQQTSTVASTTGSTAPPTAGGPHSHDPGRGPSDIRAIIVAHRDEARACYDKGLKDHPGIEGDLVVQWTIDPKGAVTAVTEDTSRSQIVEPSVVACVVKIIQGIQFAASPGGFETKAFYPFNFHPRHGTGSQGGGASPGQ